MMQHTQEPSEYGEKEHSAASELHNLEMQLVILEQQVRYLNKKTDKLERIINSRTYAVVAATGSVLVGLIVYLFHNFIEALRR